MNVRAGREDRDGDMGEERTGMERWGKRDRIGETGSKSLLDFVSMELNLLANYYLRLTHIATNPDLRLAATYPIGL